MMNIIIPMSGRGTRFEKEYSLPKPLIDINGIAMVARAIDSLNIKEAKYHFLIRNNEYSSQLTSVLNAVKPGCNIISIDYVTEGPASSALLFEECIDNKEELIIANCDQIMEWNSNQFLHNARMDQFCGMVVTYHANTNLNSYARVNKFGFVVEIREKEVISNISLNGIHYWKMGKYFVQSAKEMIANDDRAPNGEFYVGPSYNYMIKRELPVGIYHIPNQQHWSVGVPEDLQKYLTKGNHK